MVQLQLNEQFLDKASETLRAVSHPIRISIIDLLKRNKKMNVTEIHRSLDIQQAVASHHLRIMKSRNIVKVHREGQNSIYSLTDNSFYSLVELMKKILKTQNRS